MGGGAGGIFFRILNGAEHGKFAQGAIDVARADSQQGIPGAHLTQQVLNAIVQVGAIDDVLVPSRADGFG